MTILPYFLLGIVGVGGGRINRWMGWSVFSRRGRKSMNKGY